MANESLVLLVIFVLVLAFGILGIAVAKLTQQFQAERFGYDLSDGHAVYQYFFKTLYGEPAHELGPGEMYWAWWMPTDLDSRGHLMVVLPNGEFWDTMSRASNCPHNNPNNHYCWTRTGEPPNCSITPSIMSGSGAYHGFLTNGEFNPA